MKREILFKGKRIDNDEWVYGQIYYTMQGEVCVISWSDDFYYNSTHKVIPETVGQFTGLKDKNGNKIFEGDVFTHGMVEWVNGAWRFNNKNCYMVIDEHMAKNIEIIGNIHDENI